MVTLFRRAVLLAGLCAAPALAAPQRFEDLDRLETQLVAALGAGIGEPGGPLRSLDRRLKLAPCPEPVLVGGDVAGAASVRCASVGWRIRVPLMMAAAGPANVRPEKREPVIRKGDQVELAAAGGAFTVSTLAVAEQDGAPGERIRVRSEGKATRITGEVSPDGRVLVAGFK